MLGKFGAAAAAAAVAIGTLSGAAQAQAPSVRVGVLTCNVSSGWGFVFGSTRGLRCTFSGAPGHIEYYAGNISKFGVDIGYTDGGVLVWGVFAPSSDVRAGAGKP